MTGPADLRSISWSHGYLAVLAACAFAIIGLVRANCVPIGDTKATLLVAQEIARHGSVRLDAYGADTLAGYGYAIRQKNGHYYDFFPLGTPLLSAPFVAAANLLGYDMREDAGAMQIVIVCAIQLATLLMLFALACLFLGRGEAAVLAALCVFGTAIASTGFGTLFSHDFAVLLAIAAIYLVFRGLRTRQPIRASMLAACLFLAYLCRPTMALLAVFTLLHLALYRRGTAIRCGFWLAGLLTAFAVWSRHEFASWLPDYYLPQRLDDTQFGTALVQNLFGPSRGQFVYAPFLALTIPLAALLARRNADFARALLLGLAWPALHLLAISRFPHWWGGWSYGPRLMMDCLPGLFLTLFHSLGLLERGRRAAYALLAALGAFSVYVNSYVPFASPYPARWNIAPNVDVYPEYLGDWRYPQFLHDAERQRSRMAEFERVLEMPADAPDAQFEGFSPPADGVRWAGAASTLHVPLQTPGEFEGRLLVSADMQGRHLLRIRLNGRLIDEAERGGEQLRIDLRFDPAWLRGGDNTVEFDVRDAGAQTHAFGFRSLSIYPKP